MTQATKASLTCFYFYGRVFYHILTPVFVLDTRSGSVELAMKIDQVDLHGAG